MLNALFYPRKSDGILLLLGVCGILHSILVLDGILQVSGRLLLAISDLHKRKALEASQSSADLKLQLEKLQGQLDEATGIVAEKTSAIEQESFKYKRLQVSAFPRHHQLPEWRRNTGTEICAFSEGFAVAYPLKGVCCFCK